MDRLLRIRQRMEIRVLDMGTLRLGVLRVLRMRSRLGMSPVKEEEISRGLDILRRDGKRLSENVRLWSSTRVSLLPDILRVKGRLSFDPSKDVLDTIQDMNIASSVLAWLDGLSFILHSNLRCLLLSFVRKSAITPTKVASPLLFSQTDTTTIAAQIPISVLQYYIYDHHRMSEKRAYPMSSDDNESANQQLAQILQSSSSDTASVPSKQNGHSLATSSSALLDGLELSLFIISIGFLCPVLLFFNAWLYLKRPHFGPLFSLVCTILYFLFVTFFPDYHLSGIRGYLCSFLCKGFHA